MSSDNNIFIDNGDGTVTSNTHNLMWCKTDSMNDLKKWINYQDSGDYVRGLNENKYAGYDNWRLPARDEMLTLFDKSFENKDQFDKTIHISEQFSPGGGFSIICLLYTSPSPRDGLLSRMPSSA